VSWATPGTVQIIFNMFRLKPAEEVFPLAQDRRVGIIARVPLASGLLSGKMTRERHFAPDDHRLTNRHGEQFDRGETFSGVDFETGLQAAEELKRLVPPGAMQYGVSLSYCTPEEMDGPGHQPRAAPCSPLVDSPSH
jgi:aryl-alcohol dehydrogenase-like predicted oxidoreductase